MTYPCGGVKDGIRGMSEAYLSKAILFAVQQLVLGAGLGVVQVERVILTSNRKPVLLAVEIQRIDLLVAVVLQQATTSGRHMSRR